MIRINIREAVHCRDDYSMFVSFDYNQKIVDTIRELPDRWWDKTKKEWEIPLKKLPNLLSMSEFEFDITGEYVSLEEKKVELPTNFKFKTTPFAHQIEGFNYGLANNRWLLGDEQGLGKTKQVIDIAVAKKLQYGYKHCLIICGVNGLKWNWVNEVHTHSNEDAHILGMKTLKNGNIVIGSTSDKLADLNRLSSISSYFIITNVESLRDDAISAKIAELCKSKDIGIVAIDEIHKCKNPSSQQGKGILKVQSECRIAMTGTPLMNQPMDLYIILKWLGYEKNSFYAFKRHHCEMGGYGGYEIIGYKKLNELQERLDEIMLRRRKDDVLDLPDKTYINEYVEMAPKQSIIYKEISAEIKNNIDKIAIAPNPLAELIRMRQATGYTGILSSDIKESAKLDRMEELVEEAVQNGKKVVIFSNWTQMTDAIRDRLRGNGNVSKYGFVTITGDTKDEERQHKVNEFQNNPSIQIIVGTIGAMGTGLTLTSGTVEIFVDEPWNMALKNQAEDRCHRIGQKQNVTIYTLLTKDTIDERIHELIEKKGLMSDALVDGKAGIGKADLDFLLS